MARAERPGFFLRLRSDRPIIGAGIHAFDARMLGLLRHKALHASFDTPLPSSLSTPSFVDHCLNRFRPLAPLLAWVAEL